MKKATLTIGLLTLVMSITSFATPKVSASKLADNTITSIDGSGGQDTGGHKKVDYNGGTIQLNKTSQTVNIDGSGGQDTGGHKKVD